MEALDEGAAGPARPAVPRAGRAWWREAAWIAPVAAVVALRVVYWKVACPFHALTGIPCPFCGMTRAGLSLLKGDLAGAVWYNPLIFSLPVFAALLVASGLSRRVRTFFRPVAKPWILVLAIAAFWIAVLLFAHV